MTPATTPNTNLTIRAGDIAGVFPDFPRGVCLPGPSETLKARTVLLTANLVGTQSPNLWENKENQIFTKRRWPTPVAVTKALQDCDVRGAGGV
jgi:hypothetical protein